MASTHTSHGFERRLIVRRRRGTAGTIRGCGRGRFGEYTAEVVALDDLGEVAGDNVDDFDEGWIEGEDEGVAES
jgi:hypothetical protein